jgi:hypothetical protein
LKFYADVHKTKKNKERYRITYTTDGITFKHIDSFSEIPAGPGEKLFMDTIPPQHTDGAIELLRRGVEVYYELVSKLFKLLLSMVYYGVS